MSRVYWDARLFAYWLEDHPVQAERLEQARQRMEARGDQLCTSVHSLAEILVAPYRHGDPGLAARIREHLGPPQVELLAFTPEVADRAAQLAAQHRLDLGDAVHLATAAVAGVDLFLTDAAPLAALTVPGIRFLAALGSPLY